MSKDRLIPEIRFPEFKKEGQWEEIALDDIGNLVASGDLDSNSFSNEQTDVHIYPVYSNSVTNEGLYGFNTYSKFKPNSVTITARGTLGVAFVRKSEFVGIGRLLVLSELNNTDAVFFKENWNHFAKVPLENGGIPQLTAVKAKSVKLLFPKLPEQQKIASCLSSLDEVIAAHSQKLDLLKDHKKGLMQNLFPNPESSSGGEKVPKYRFKEFEKDGEWVEKSFEELFVIGNGRDYKHLDKGKIPVYGSGGYMLSVNEYLYDGESVCIGRKGTIDKPMFLTGKFWTVDTLFYSHSFKKCLPKYIFYVFENINWRNHNEAGGVPSLSKTNIYKIEVLVPPTIQEQQEIASCLSSLDALITAQTEKIEQLKLHKKGLMQGLFPTVKTGHALSQ